MGVFVEVGGDGAAAERGDAAEHVDVDVGVGDQRIAGEAGAAGGVEDVGVEDAHFGGAGGDGGGEVGGGAGVEADEVGDVFNCGA